MVLDNLCNRMEAHLTWLNSPSSCQEGREPPAFRWRSSEEAESVPEAEEESCAMAGSRRMGTGTVPCVLGAHDSLCSDSIKCLLSNSSGECSALLLAGKQASPL